MEQTMIQKLVEQGTVKEVGHRTLEFIGSSEAVDRDGDIMLAKGWDLKGYKKNPVFLWAHDYRQPPIGKTTKVYRQQGQLRFQVEFADKDTYEFADTIYKLYKGGFLHATSVGFIPKETKRLEEKDERREMGARQVISKQELLELSAVPVPSNPEALVSARDAGVITTKELQAFKSETEKPYPNEHACRLRNPADFQEGSFRRTSREHEGKKYSIIMGKLKGSDSMTEQAYRYPKDTWDASAARSHCKAHGGTFEAAASDSLTDEARKMLEEIKDEGGVANFVMTGGLRSNGDTFTTSTGSSWACDTTTVHYNTSDASDITLISDGDIYYEYHPETKQRDQDEVSDDIDLVIEYVKEWNLNDDNIKMMEDLYEILKSRFVGDDTPIEIEKPKQPDKFWERVAESIQRQIGG